MRLWDRSHGSLSFAQIASPIQAQCRSRRCSNSCPPSRPSVMECSPASYTGHQVDKYVDVAGLEAAQMPGFIYCRFEKGTTTLKRHRIPCAGG